MPIYYNKVYKRLVNQKLLHQLILSYKRFFWNNSKAEEGSLTWKSILAKL